MIFYLHSHNQCTARGAEDVSRWCDQVVVSAQMPFFRASVLLGRGNRLSGDPWLLLPAFCPPPWMWKPPPYLLSLLQAPPPPPPPPPPLQRRGSSSGGGEVARDDRPLFDALYVVSVEAEATERGKNAGFPSSSVEAYKRANRRCDPRVVWRCVRLLLGF